jgi:anti-sigma factor RsiW
MAMICRRVELLIQAYVDGAASRGEREVVDAHVSRCGRCAAAMAESRRLVAVLAGAPAREVSDTFERNLMAAVRHAAPVSSRAAWWERFQLRFEWRLRVPAMVTAGSLAVAVIAAVVAPQVAGVGEARRERGQYVSQAVQRHRQIEQTTDVNWEALDASIQLSTGTIVTE